MHDWANRHPRLCMATFDECAWMQAPFGMLKLPGRLSYVTWLSLGAYPGVGALHSCSQSKHLDAYPGVGACPGHYGIYKTWSFIPLAWFSCLALMHSAIIYVFKFPTLHIHTHNTGHFWHWSQVGPCSYCAILCQLGNKRRPQYGSQWCPVDPQSDTALSEDSQGPRKPITEMQSDSQLQYWWVSRHFTV